MISAESYKLSQRLRRGIAGDSINFFNSVPSPAPASGEFVVIDAATGQVQIDNSTGQVQLD